MKLKFIVDKEKDIQKTLDFKLLNEALDFMKKQYDIEIDFLNYTKKIYQDSWNEIGDEFSDYIERITGYRWFYDEYTCVVSVIHRGISNWGVEALIFRIWKENPHYSRRITAHELILSHFFEICKRNFKEENLKNGQIWALAETTAFILTSLEKDTEKFWPWGNEYYTNHNYPHIVDIQNKMKDIYSKEKDFSVYLRKGFDLIKKFPNINPKGLE